MTTMQTMDDFNLSGKRVLIREDLNVPLNDGKVADDSRILAALPTIKQAVEEDACVLIVSHLGRPKEGQFDEAFSLTPVAKRLSELLGQNVTLAKNWLDGVDIEPGQVVLCENIRFAVGEKSNDDSLSRKMAALCDVFINDAFATAHRSQASTHGIAKYAPKVCAGPLLKSELDALGKALEEPATPMVAIVGGAKVSTKLEVLESLVSRVDQLIVGGGIANTFIKAAGYEVGNSLYEEDLVDVAKGLIESAKQRNAEIPIPVDVVCAKAFSEDAEATVKPVEEITADDMILDLGPETVAGLVKKLDSAGTIVWNGPLGVFEFEQFSHGTAELSKAIAASSAYSIAGGGDTLAAISKFGISDQVSYISTGGGAFLELLEGKTLPAVAILEERARANPTSCHPSEGY